ncbi:SpoIIE family protein phosphatase [Streptomyces tropicalis]|uniref:SpoIIE family protein phosphatase n=1 Tax=Streptomyces tropicalis TaxID=3034234 RepID=A0ABT6AE06_9ACTN|nr:SpoIIE family protein phosphatase [Streptomyces tropicalis]MDF3302881.1 SpoIIE family protein phosphatase [Streptomyces tropicalis]
MEHVAAAAIVDARGIVTAWTVGARRLTGYPAEEAVGRAAADLLVGEPSRAVRRALTGIVLVRRRDGDLVELGLTACPVVGPDGVPEAYIITAGPPDEPEPTLSGRMFQQAPMPICTFDTDLRYLRVNDTACRVLGATPSELIGRRFVDTMPDEEAARRFAGRVRQVVRSGSSVRFETFGRAPSEGREHAWTIEMWPVRDAAEGVAAVAVAAFDSTEEHGARRRLALLNEAATAIGTTLDVVRTAEELVEIAVPRFADFVGVDLLEWVLGTEETPPPEPTGDVVLRRVAHGSVTDRTPESAVAIGEKDLYPAFSSPARALRLGRAVLSRAGDPDFERWTADRDALSPRSSEHREGMHAMLAVPLRARGITLGVAVFVRISHPEAFAPDDAVLAEELASRAAVSVDNARRYARERATALALQHSLLPRRPRGQAAVEVSHRYLPSGSLAGVGGDWFDVIPLSGSRVALVVGDVVGHGIRSSATMGRLRTAVRTLADVDLPPDELLTHLDDLVTHLVPSHGGEDVPEVGATCLYVVYDPVSRLLSAAAAGHPPPAVVPAGGPARLVEMTAGPPLGVGGFPFEATELTLPEGSMIALYTDGLVEGPDGDFEKGTAEMCRALSIPADSLDAVCDHVLESVLPDQPGDDVALLLARTRILGGDRVATWDVTRDPAQVGVARQAASEQLAAWGLEEAAFVTELVVSELVTNAIRYGEPPIQLRLIRDRALICEVSDGSATSPHLRRARAFDEGGRGLLLVAQLTQRWGSRQTTSGKAIWAEQPLLP